MDDVETTEFNRHKINFESIEARDMDAKLLSALKSNNTLARCWFRKECISSQGTVSSYLHFFQLGWSICHKGFLSSVLLWLVIIVAVFVTTVIQDTNEIYERLNEAQDARAVLSGRLNLLQRDKSSHAYTALLMEREARLSREAWGRLMDASDTAHSKVRALRTTVLAQQTEIAALQAADRARQGQQGPARGPAQPEVPEEASSSS
ncbi:hypothetical protein Tco_0393592 [Tanacetum coccineum]